MRTSVPIFAAPRTNFKKKKEKGKRRKMRASVSGNGVQSRACPQFYLFRFYFFI